MRGINDYKVIKEVGGMNLRKKSIDEYSLIELFEYTVCLDRWIHKLEKAKRLLDLFKNRRKDIGRRIFKTAFMGKM